MRTLWVVLLLVASVSAQVISVRHKVAPTAPIALVGTPAATANTTGTTAAVTRSYTAGNAVLAIGTVYNATALRPGITGTACNGDWIPLVENDFLVTPGSSNLYMYLCRSIKSGSQTITFNVTISTAVSLQVREYSGVDSASAFDVQTYLRNTTAAKPTLAAITVENSGSAIVGCAIWDSGTQTPAANTGYANIFNATTDGTGHAANSCADNLNVSAGSVSPIPLCMQANCSSTGTNALVAAVVLKKSGVPSGVQFHNRQNFFILTDNNGAHTITLNGVTAGASLYAVIRGMGAGVTLTTLREGASNNFTLTAHSPLLSAGNCSSGVQWKFWYGYLDNVSSGAHTITFQTSGAAHLEVSVYEFGGMTPGGSFDADSTALGTGTGATVNTGTVVSTASADVIIESIVIANQFLYMQGGYTDGFMSDAGNGDGYKTKKPAATYTANGIQNSSGTWCSMLAAFK